MKPVAPRFALRRMTSRDPGEPHRAASSLELLFDLVFVVAVSFASVSLHHDLQHGHVAAGVVSYAMAFFGLWWAWMNFTWFATSFDTDDWLYRVATVVQMGGALTYAAGLPRFMDLEHPDYTLGVVGYVIMRLPMAFQWFRASVQDPASRPTTLRYAIGIVIVQCYWTLLIVAPAELRVPTFAVGVVLELLVPIVGERPGSTPWHEHHITERYGLFTLIVLGESILASTNAVVEVSQSTEHLARLVLLAGSSLVVIVCFWWIYFALPQHGLLTSMRTALGWGYGHYVVFASAAALSAGIEVALDEESGDVALSTAGAAATLAVPCAIYLAMVWFLLLRRRSSRRVDVVVPSIAVLIALASFVPFSLQVVAVLMVAAVVCVATGGGTPPIGGDTPLEGGGAADRGRSSRARGA